jgi:hypothetical protein
MLSCRIPFRLRELMLPHGLFTQSLWPSRITKTKWASQQKTLGSTKGKSNNCKRYIFVRRKCYAREIISIEAHSTCSPLFMCEVWDNPTKPSAKKHNEHLSHRPCSWYCSVRSRYGWKEKVFLQTVSAAYFCRDVSSFDDTQRVKPWLAPPAILLLLNLISY